MSRKVIAVANHKGGTAKTTTTVTLGVILAQKGYKVLLIDLDAQGSMSLNFGHHPSYQKDPNIYEVLIHNIPIRNVVKKIREDTNLYLLTSDTRLDKAREMLVTESKGKMPLQKKLLQRAIQSIREDYDFILFDCNPSINILTINAFSASDAVLIPMSCEFLAMSGVGQVVMKIADKGIEVNPDLKILGVLLTRYDTRAKDSYKVMKQTKRDLSLSNLSKGVSTKLNFLDSFKIFDTYIREGVRVKEAPRYAGAVVEYSPKDRTSIDYTKFANEFLNHVQTT